ncbi:EamA family transporter [Alteromonadales bacterium alter-6D02]|nr:EamA family transporter [Alteromonadales bacterium alter-6D02]
MKVPIAFLSVILIWSTTPLAIIWSSESVHPTMAVLLRMLIAAVLGSFLLVLMRIKLPMSTTALRLYAYSALGIYGGMMCGYFAAAHVSSGMMSLVFGLSPVVAGLLAPKILNEAKLSPVKLLALVVSFLGLAIVCWDKLSTGQTNLFGMSLVIIAMCFFSLSSVLVKSVTISIHPLATTIGALYCSLPFFALTWLITDGSFNTEQWTSQSIAAIVYLGIFGSLIGFIAYFFVLQKLDTSTVALITLIAPVFAVTLGVLLNGESISYSLLIGAGCIMLGLSIYNWGEKLFKKRTVSVLSSK